VATDVVLGICEEGANDEQLEQLGIQLRRELLGLELERVRPATAEAPEGARSGLAMMTGALVASISPAKLAAVVTTIVDWLRRGRSSGKPRTVELEIDGDRIVLTGASTDAEKELTDLFVKRHSARESSDG
jgi:hypothetical protein